MMLIDRSFCSELTLCSVPPQILIFFCSLFGDLLESVMKRDAGMKVRGTRPCPPPTKLWPPCAYPKALMYDPSSPRQDSGDLIPGHGGLLDRFDSYMLTGAMVYFYTRMIAPFFGI